MGEAGAFQALNQPMACLKNNLWLQSSIAIQQKAQNHLANLGKNGPTETALDFRLPPSFHQAPTPEQNPAYGMDIGAAAQQ